MLFLSNCPTSGLAFFNLIGTARKSPEYPIRKITLNFALKDLLATEAKAKWNIFGLNRCATNNFRIK